MIRLAQLTDILAIRNLVQTSARSLARADYTAEQIEAALEGAWGVDTQLIRDQTYFCIEIDGTLAAGGGWSRRKTLFGSDAHAAREPELLDPVADAARIRAFFVHPNFARRGLGRMLLEHCESEARKEGFERAELVATLPGVKLYSACGYEEIERREYEIAGGLTILFVHMQRQIEPRPAELQ